MAASGDVFERPRTYSGRWTNEQLDGLRKVTDEHADAVIAEYFEGAGEPGNGPDAVAPHELLKILLNDRVQPPSRVLSNGKPISQHLLDELAARSPLPEVPGAEVLKGQELFQSYGPEMLLNLACFSLPMAYGAARGAQVLHQTGYLEQRVQRRLIETTQLVVDVMKPNGLDPGGDGLRSAHEVRLMHGAIRYLISHQIGNGGLEWDLEELGQPINQEDMAGTLMTFSYVVLKGLHTLGLRIDRADQEAYLAAWRYVGTAMGMREEMLPRNLEEAQELTWFIYDRQMKGSEEGVALMKALLDTMRGNLPRIARWFAPSALRALMLKELADALKVPRNLFWDTITVLLLRLYVAINKLINIDGLGVNPHRWFSHLVIELVMRMGRGDNPEFAFRLPEELRDHWKKMPKKKRG